MNIKTDSFGVLHLHSTLLLLLLTFLIHRLVITPRRSSFKNIPGPAPNDLLTGNLKPIFQTEPGEWHLSQTATYGPVYRIRGFAGSDQLFIADPEALKHVLSKKCYQYTKPKQLGPFKDIFGQGILFSDGQTHARQRRIMQSAFTQRAVDSYKEDFEQVALKVRLPELISKLLS